MTYSLESIVRFVMALFLALMFVCVSAFDPDITLWGDLLIRLGGTAMVFVLGFGVGFDKAKDGADNDR